MILTKKFVRHILSGNRDVLRQSAVTLLGRSPLPECNYNETEADSVNKGDNFDERTWLEKATISSIIPDPEQFSVSADSGSFFNPL